MKGQPDQRNVGDRDDQIPADHHAGCQNTVQQIDEWYPDGTVQGPGVSQGTTSCVTGSHLADE